MAKNKNHIRDSKSRILFSAFNYLFFLLLILFCAYPLWYVFVQSLSGAHVAGKGVLIPNEFTLTNYVQVMELRGIFHAFLVSVARTVIGTAGTVICCMLLGYLFTKEQMPFRKLLYRMVTITMYVSGGLIPTFLVIKAYHLTNTFWVYVLPSLVSAYYIILIKTYVEQLPASVEESAMLDGAGVVTIFLRIILPMSMPIVATIAVYASVAQCNAWFDNHIYTFTRENLTTLQYTLYQYLNEAERIAKQLEEGNVDERLLTLTPQGVRMTVTMVTVLPVIMIYPFLQRFFIKGIMIGAVKG